MENFASEYWSGQGPAFLGPRDASGNPAGVKFLGDVAAVEITPTVGRTKIKENVSGNRLDGASFVNSTEYAIRITMKSAKPEHLVRALGADLTVRPAGTVTSEPHVVYLDSFVPLAHVKATISSVTNVGATVTYAPGTDYVAHGDEGMIEFLSGGTVTDLQDVEVNYTYAAQKRLQTNYVTEDLALVCPAMNRARGNKRGRLSVHKINLDPSALSAIIDGDQEASMELQGTVLVDTTRAVGDQIYTWDMED